MFPSIKNENLTYKISLSGPPNNDSKYKLNNVFNLHDPLDTIPLSKIETENTFLPITGKKNTRIITRRSKS